MQSLRHLLVFNLYKNISETITLLVNEMLEANFLIIDKFFKNGI